MYVRWHEGMRSMITTKTSIEVGCMDMVMWLLANRGICVLMHDVGLSRFLDG